MNPWEVPGSILDPEEKDKEVMPTESPEEAPQAPTKTAETAGKNPWEVPGTIIEAPGRQAEEFAPTPTGTYEGLNFENLQNNRALMQTIREYYSERDGEDLSDLSDEEMAKEFVYDRMLKDQNLVIGALPELYYITSEASPEQKKRLAELRAAWDALPAFWEEGGRGFVGLAENLVTAAEDPATWLTGGVGGLVAKGAAKAGIGKLVSAGAGITTTAALEGAANADIEVAHQNVEKEIGVREDIDPAQVGMAYFIGAAGAGIVGGAGHGIASITRKRAQRAALRQTQEIIPETSGPNRAPPVDTAEVAKSLDEGGAYTYVVKSEKENGGILSEDYTIYKEKAPDTDQDVFSVYRGNEFEGEELVAEGSKLDDIIAELLGRAPEGEATKVSRFRNHFASQSGWVSNSLERLKNLSSPNYLLDKVFDRSGNIRQKVFDANISLRVGELGQQLGDYWNNEAYRNFRLFRALPQQIMIMLEGGRFNFSNLHEMIDAEMTGKAMKMGDLSFLPKEKRAPLVEIFRPLNNEEGGVSGYLSYIAAQRMRQLKETKGIEYPEGILDSDVQAVIDNGNTREAYSAIKTEMDAYNENLMDMLVATGVLDLEGKARILDANGGWYVPFYRVSEEFSDGAIKSRRSTGVGESGLKRLFGGEGQIDDLLTNVIGNTESLVTAAMYNATKRSLYDKLQEMPQEIMEQFAVRVPPKAKASYIDPDAVITQMRKNIEANDSLPPGQKEQALMELDDLVENLTPETMVFWSRMGKPQGNIDVVMRNGKAEYWEIKDPMLMDTLSNLNGNIGLPPWMQAWSKGKRMFTKLVTHEPTFVFRNTIRDTVTSAVLTKYRSASTATPLTNVITSMAMELRSSPEYGDFMLNGGGFSSIRANEVGLDDLKIREYYVRKNINPDTVLWSQNKFSKAMKKMWAGYDRALSGAENAARFSEFRSAKKAGKSSREAAFAGRDVSTDFGMRGSAKTMQFLSSVAPFFNPGVQGLYHTSRRLQQDPVGVGTMATLYLTAPTLLLAEFNKEYDVVQNQPEYVKDTHWIIPLTEDDIPFPSDPSEATRVFLIPKPYDIGAIFATLPEYFMRAFEEKGATGDAAEEFLYNFYRVVTDQMLLDPTPFGVGAAKNWVMNTNFTGRPTVPARMEGIMPEYQFDADTNIIAREIGQRMGLSPKKVEQLMADLFGSGGQLVSDSIDLAIRAATDEPDLASPEWLPLPINQIPVAKAFYKYEPMPTADETALYNLLSRASVPSDTYKYLKQEGRVEDILDIMNSVPGMANLMANDKALSGSVKKFSTINRRIRQIQAAPDSAMTSEQKFAEIKQLKQSYRDVVSSIVTSLKKDPTLANYMRARNVYTATVGKWINE